MAKSFLKWAGGKHWLVNNESNRFPKQFNKYIEPFLGGGAVFFHIAPKEAIISDINTELIDTYIAVRDEFDLVFQELINHQENNSKEYYYSVRDCNPEEAYLRAARMIYLNKTCFNGIYRVNKAGRFNVPYGSERSLNFNKEKLNNVSNILKNDI